MTPELISAMATIASSLVSGGVAIVVCVLTNNAAHKKLIAELDKRSALQELQIEQTKETIAHLAEKVDQHNHLDRRIVALEEQVKTLFNETRQG